jgi:hypothetical protein
MPNQERPSKPVAESYVPPAGIRHPVTTGETWISLAKRVGIDPWDLIEFNFPGVKLVKQRDFEQATRQVNWYLAEYVGCRAMSPDRQNFAFSSGTTGGKGVWQSGFIYLPPGTPPPPPVAPAPPAAPTPPRCQANRPDFARVLDAHEQGFARKVFGPTLPSWDSIAITNGLGGDGRPWTNDGPFFTGSNPMVPNMRYAINLGNVAFKDLTSQGPTLGLLCADFGRICDLFVHEMTHVWQAFNDSNWTMGRSLWAQLIGAGYEYTPGDTWDSYNVEQQAHIVEDWHKYKDSFPTLAEDRYPYVRLVIRSGRLKFPRGLDLAALKSDLQDLRNRRLD